MKKLTPNEIEKITGDDNEYKQGIESYKEKLIKGMVWLSGFSISIILSALALFIGLNNQRYGDNTILPNANPIEDNMVIIFIFVFGS